MPGEPSQDAMLELFGGGGGGSGVSGAGDQPQHDARVAGCDHLRMAGSGVVVVESVDQQDGGAGAGDGKFRGGGAEVESVLEAAVERRAEYDGTRQHAA